MATNDLSDVCGFVLREFPYKETSKIIEIFTADFGRISILAKGALSKKSKTLGVTQRFVKASYNFCLLYTSPSPRSYGKSNKNFDIILYKSAIADLLLRTIDQIQSETIFKLLDNTFEAFENADCNQINIFLAFLLKYISFSGFKPNLNSCSICGKRLSYKEVFFSPYESSIICDDDKNLIRDKIFLNKEEFTYLKKLLYTKSEDLAGIEKPAGYKKIAILIIDYTLKNLEITRFSSIDWVYRNVSERN